MTRRRMWVAIAADAAAWTLVQAGTGYFVHRLSDRRLERDGWLMRERAWERGGRYYVDVLRIRRWKALLPEAGAAFPGGFDKRHLRGRGPAELARHIRETRRAELGHWLAIAPTPLFVWCSPPLLAPFMVVYAAAVNLPCIAAQRYNRLRLQRALARRRRPSPLSSK